MKTENVILMRMARESLQGKWGLAIGTFVIYLLIVGAIQAVAQVAPLAGLVSLIIAGPFAVGIAKFSLALSRNNDPKTSQIFEGFNNFGSCLATYLLMVLYIILWSLLLIVPGIIAAISYSMSFFILSEEPTLSAQDVLKKSKEMMDGYKLKFFYLGLRFFLLGLLCILTLGIGFFWLLPYIQVTTAKFYDDLKGEGQRVTEDLIDQVS